MRFLLPALLFALAAMVTACANSDAPSGQISTSTELPPTSTPTLVPTPTIGPGVDQTLEDELVPDFPADFPVPPGAQVVQSSRTTDEAGQVSISAHFQAQMTVQEAAAFYSDTFSEPPWEVALENVEDTAAFFQFTNTEDAAQSGFISIAPTEDEVGVLIQVLLGGGGATLLTPTPTVAGTPVLPPPPTPSPAP
jgi:hypothetical protein